MTDNKSCESCGRTKHLCESKGVCEQWLRNPRKWLSILPTEPETYWYRLKNRPSDYGLMEVSLEIIKGWDKDDAKRIHAEHFQWQGPIKPEDA